MRLLVFNCHEAWVHQLKALDCDLDIIVGLAGHHIEVAVQGLELVEPPPPPP